MAIRGAKPKPAHLKIIEGNPGKRDVVRDPASDLPAGFDNGLSPPKKLRKRQQWLWDRYVRTASWLRQHDETKALMWCELYAEFEKSPGAMVAGKIAQVRALGSELGLDPGSRSRLGGKPEGPAGKFTGLIGAKPKDTAG